MADDQELEDGWQARDLRSGVAKVYQDAKRRSIMGIRAAAAWSVICLIFAIVDMAGIVNVGPPMWEFAAALGVMLLSALGMSRTPGPMLAAASVILVDLVVIAYRVPGLFESQDTTNIAMTSIRVTLAPVALTMVVSGYLGALSIQAFKLGFSPGQDWRTRLNPMMLQVAVIGSCVGALGIGAAVWFGAIGAGFAQTNVLWRTYDPIVNNIDVKTARPKSNGPDDTKAAKTDGKTPEPFLNISILHPGDNDAESAPKIPVYPDSAKPVTSTAGWEAYGKREIEDAWEWGEDSTDEECFAEGQGRQGRCRDERCQMWSRVFVRACLTKAKKTPKYCDEVPDPTDEDAGTLWAQKLCAGREFELCREILYAVQGHCHPPEEVAAKQAAANLPSKSDGKPDAKPEARPEAKPGATSKAPGKTAAAAGAKPAAPAEKVAEAAPAAPVASPAAPAAPAEKPAEPAPAAPAEPAPEKAAEAPAAPAEAR